MKILIIGSNGFIGGFLAKRLIGCGHEVVGMDIRPREPEENSYHFALGDVLNPEDIMKVAKGTDAIIHLAAKHRDYGISREEFFRFNVGSTQNILDCAAKLGIKKFIFYSTVAVYGNHKTFTTEDTLPEPVSDYGKSKLAAEQRIYNWVCQDPSREAAIIRPTVVFGPENFANMYSLINSIYKRRFIFVGKGENIKSVAYVENLVDATIFLFQRLKPGVEINNYSDYPQLSAAEIVKTISHYLKCSMPRLRIPLRPAMMATSVFDLMEKVTGYNFPITAKRIKKFNTATHHKAEKIKALGFKAKVDLAVGFKRMVEWYLNNGKGTKLSRDETK